MVNAQELQVDQACKHAQRQRGYSIVGQVQSQQLRVVRKGVDGNGGQRIDRQVAEVVM